MRLLGVLGAKLSCELTEVLALKCLSLRHDKRPKRLLFLERNHEVQSLGTGS